MGRRIRIVLFALFIVIVISLSIIAAAALFPAPKPGGPGMPAIVSLPFTYYFNSKGTLHEVGSIEGSTSPYWWLNSGGKLHLSGAIGTTVQGDLPLTDRWRLLYAVSNPTDTDGGRHPQNLFRLVSRSTMENARVQSYFKVVKDNLSDSPNRNASNGLLLMSRYAENGDTLYYAGIRVDGTAVIKKKYKGSYYTMAQKKIFDGTYSASSNPNLIPHNEWIALRSDTVTNSDGSVTVQLSMRREGSSWMKILEARDDGEKYGGTQPITGKGHVGIRTDFMDVYFDMFRADKI